MSIDIAIERFEWAPEDVESAVDVSPPDFLEGKAYDPREARDHHGRWIDGAGDAVTDVATNLLIANNASPDDAASAQRIIMGIASVHGYPPGTPSTRIQYSPVMVPGVDGDYDPSYEVVHVLQGERTGKAGTLLHELGHKLDHALGLKASPRAGDRAFLSSMAAMSPGHRDVPEIAGVAALMDRIRHSDAYGHLNTGPLASGLIPGPGYWTKPHELFARAYAQYMAGRLGEHDVRWQVDAVTGTSEDIMLGDQWSDEDFKPIAQAFDDLLATTGLAVPEGTKGGS